MTPLIVNALGAVTPVGLTAAQTCAAIRARLSGFREVLLAAPPAEPVVCGCVPAHRRLRATAERWLVNLAVRALRECGVGERLDSSTTALLMSGPDRYREHTGTSRGPAALLRAVERDLGIAFHPSSTVTQDGHAGVFAALLTARLLLETGTVERCLVGGVDSLVNRRDVERLAAAGRLHDSGNPQGVIPGEGAAFLLVSTRETRTTAVAQLTGVGLSREADTVLGDRNAIGTGLQSALEAAGADARCAEPQVSFRVSDMNGERYHAWDSIMASMRYYRSRRERFPTWYPMSCTGDLGAAAGAVDLMCAATAIARGYAPGPIAMCEGSSDEGLRGACVMTNLDGRRVPPFLEHEV